MAETFVPIVYTDTQKVLLQGACTDCTSTDDVDDEVRILLIGKTGVGKSALANIIIGAEVFESEPSPESVTNRCQYHKCRRFDRNIVVVDTPGVFDTKHSKDAVLTEITKCYALTSPGPHAVLMVRRLDRFTDEEKETIEIFHKHFGNDVFKYMILVITSEGSSFRDKTKQYMAKTMEIGAKCSQTDSVESYQTYLLYDVIKKSGDRYLPFNISDDGYTDDGQVRDLLKTIDNLVAENQGKYFTNANFECVERCMEMYMNHIRNFPDEPESPEETDDPNQFLIPDRGNMMEFTGLPECSSLMNYSPRRGGSREDLAHAQMARMTKSQRREQVRDDIQKEKRGILWAIRNLIKVIENAILWVKAQFQCQPVHEEPDDHGLQRI